jgi:hypothetical protein
VVRVLLTSAQVPPLTNKRLAVGICKVVIHKELSIHAAMLIASSGRRKDRLSDLEVFQKAGRRSDLSFRTLVRVRSDRKGAKTKNARKQ